MAQFEELHKTHLSQLLEFLKFDKTVREKIQREVREELEELLDSRITVEDTYTGDELIELLNDIPDVIEGVIDHGLEHQRDITMVLIQRVFLQARAKDHEILLNVSQIEDEKMVKASHEMCESLLYEPSKALGAAPDAPGGKVAAAPAQAPADSGNAELDRLRAENAQLKAQIEAGLKGFPQYQKTMEMIHQREVEIRGLQARL